MLQKWAMANHGSPYKPQLGFKFWSLSQEQSENTARGFYLLNREKSLEGSSKILFNFLHLRPLRAASFFQYITRKLLPNLLKVGGHVFERNA